MPLTHPVYHDVLIVLGCGHQTDDPNVKERCRLAADLFHQGRAAQVLLSGGYETGLDIKPIRNQAEALRYCLIENDVPASCLFLEDHSSQLVESLYFCKTEFLLPCSWFDVGIVTGANAILTTDWIANKVLGEQTTLTVYPGRERDFQPSATDQKSLATLQNIYRGIRDGDHQAAKDMNAVSLKN